MVFGGWLGVNVTGLERAHAVDAAVLAPATERLAFPPEEDTEEAPEEYERGVCHDRRNEPAMC
jgi:hypothetical protein